MYNAVHMFALAAEQARSVETDRLIAALEGVRFKAPQGEVYMRAKDHQIVVPSRAGPERVEGLRGHVRHRAIDWAGGADRGELYIPAEEEVVRPSVIVIEGAGEERRALMSRR